MMQRRCRAGIYITTVHLINLNSDVLLRYTLLFVCFYLCYVASQIILSFFFSLFYCGKSFWITLFYTYCVRRVKHRDRLCPRCTQALVSKGLPTKHPGSNSEAFWLQPVIKITANVQQESSRIVYMLDPTSSIQFSSVLQY